ncbi:Cell cycle control protein 50C [Acipenser ruthenus]|uniref:Cell cycle control protein 50C n=1 Tax=Acipenser ruthenus TaxID=7906 RepID=A0A662YU27_ACIRT|nr:Cell cycle control protein 50C [Acipenser ruthenus]
MCKTECIGPKKEKQEDEKDTKPKRKRKKKITDVLAASAPKPGCPADLQKLFEDNFTDKRSVIEMEELKLPVCPKWAKLCKNHTEQKSVVMLIVCSSAHRVLDLIKQLTTFKGNAKVLKLFAKHIKVEEQIKLLQKGVTHVGVGTPGRIKALTEQDGLSLKALKYVVLDWNWRDQKLRRMPDIPEVDYTEERDCAECYTLRLDRANSIIDCACTVFFSLSEAFKGDVFMYYGLTNFHQNQRHYMVSRDDAQLVGRQYNLKNPSITCVPFDKYKNGTPIAPCGAIANSLFNDTLQLFYHSDKNTETPVPLLKTDISWFTDRTVKFQNPSPKDNLTAAFAGTARPFYWWKPAYQLSVEENNNGFVNEDLIVWMRQAAFPSFKKLYRQLNRTQEFNDGLPAGNYSVKISYSILSQALSWRNELSHQYVTKLH